MTDDPRDVECAREAVKLALFADRAFVDRSAILAAKLARERAEAGGVDPLTLRARELLAVEAERKRYGGLAAAYRDGKLDDAYSIRAVRAALSEGKR